MDFKTLKGYMEFWEGRSLSMPSSVFSGAQPVRATATGQGLASAVGDPVDYLGVPDAPAGVAQSLLRYLQCYFLVAGFSM